MATLARVIAYCYHGVSDIFRIPKAAAGFYKSQCEPSEEVVLEPAFNWSSGDHSSAGGPGIVPVCSNCDHLKLYIDGTLHTEADPDRKTFAHLKYPPFMVDLSNLPLTHGATCVLKAISAASSP
jgi:beta-galactosidase